MKSKYKYRKEWEKVATQLSMRDTPHHTVMTDRMTGQENAILINNYRRFVRGMCELPLEEQRTKLAMFKGRMEELQAAQLEARTQGEKQITNLVNKPEVTETAPKADGEI